MSDKIELSTFPPGRAEALTMLYLKRLALSKVEPEELATRYLDTVEKIRNSLRDNKKSGFVNVN